MFTFFGVVDHYNDDSYDFKKGYSNCENEECFICLQNKCDYGSQIIKLNSGIFYYKSCLCDGYIHKTCLDIWYDRSHKCPICRNFIERKHIMYNVIFINCNYLLLTYISIKNKILLFTQYITFIFFIYYIFDFYLLINSNILNKNDYDFNDHYSIYYLNKSVC